MRLDAPRAHLRDAVAVLRRYHGLSEAVEDYLDELYQERQITEEDEWRRESKATPKQTDQCCPH